MTPPPRVTRTPTGRVGFRLKDRWLGPPRIVTTVEVVVETFEGFHRQPINRYTTWDDATLHNIYLKPKR